ncbi:hypothetical protein [uncultured Gimesia sp.]|uniref:CAF17-like 4Fe-4S cluster assembly/insertion protein YgfZ n=1 Tax=uncultured Gimesia sp. TaxID=1678688 RepID=UPI0030DA98B6|tara:strand:- start:121413 stop:122489 length:1077 start_codon:yes stop_codon:yes gene_type:complete
MPLRQFQTLQQSQGAVFKDLEQVYPLASDFGTPEKEYQSAQENAVLFDLSHRDQLELKGKDREKFLHNFCTNDIKSLQPDHGCEAFITNVQSRILGHIFAFNHEESIWIDTAPGESTAIIKHLDRYLILEDANFEMRTPEFGNLYLTGPDSIDMLCRTGIPVESLAVNQQLRVSNGDKKLTVRRVDWLQQPGFLCCLQYVKISDLWTNLLEVGATSGGQDVFQALCIESVFPTYGIDLSEENLAQEANRTDRAISFKKGCYLGQEPIARIDSLGHVNRELRAIGLDQAWVPPAGTKVVVKDAEERQEVGTIASSAKSYGKYPAVAMALLRRGSNDPGTEVQLVSEDQEFLGTVLTSLN